MHLVADLGNTQIKIALFQDGEIQTIHRVDQEKASGLIGSTKNVKAAIVSSVLTNDHPLVEKIKNQFDTLVLDHQTNLPISNNYETPETLGNDRLANAVAAHMTFEKDNALIVDFGTCIKFDFVRSDGRYLGGAISPGLAMRYKALNHFTEQLPLINKTEKIPLVGHNTEDSIASGVVKGIEAEVSGIISSYEQKFGNVKVIFTGGDHIHFASLQKNGIFARPNLTLEGLYKILIHNEIR